MYKGIIPRVRVNYSLWELFLSIFQDEKSEKNQTRVENTISSLFKDRPVLMTSSGRAALYFILKYLPQNKVIIPAYTCSVVAESILLAGKQLYFVKLEESGFNSNYFDKLDSITIVIATHQFGYPCDIKQIAQKCREAKAILIEDCAAAIDSKIDGERIGVYGDYAFISFNHSKQLIIPCGGGCVIAKDAEALNRIKEVAELKKYTPATRKSKIKFALICLLLNNKYIYSYYYASKKLYQNSVNISTLAKIRYEIDDSYSYKLGEWQLFLLHKQLHRMEQQKIKRINTFQLYDRLIKNPLVIKPIPQEGADYSRYVIQIKNEKRDLFYSECVKSGVDFDFSHSHIAAPPSYSKEHKLASSILNVPLYYKLTIKEAKKIVEIINRIEV